MNKNPHYTSATDLAKLGTCERQAVLQTITHKKAVNSSVRAAHGIASHTSFFQENTDKRCFIASAVFGQDAPETNQLRTFRDERLKPYRIGRGFIKLYYATSPYALPYLNPPVVRKGVASLLRFLLRWIGSKG